MNILLITQLFPSDDDARYSSGALREFVIEWEKMGNQVQVFRPHFGYEEEPFVEEPFIIGENIQVEFIKPIRIPLLKCIFYNDKKLISKLKFKPDIVICHLYNSYFTFSDLAGKLKVPFVVGIHMSDVKIAKNVFHRFHQNLVFNKADIFACRSRAYEKKFHFLFPNFSERTFIAESGIASNYLNLNIKKQKISEIRIVTVSRLITRKQVDKVIYALSDLSLKNKWKYTIVGEGHEDSNLKKLTKQLGLEERVQFTGSLKREEVIKLLYQNDIFILPSYEETFGLVYLEAMAAGCVTIGSLNEGIDGIISDAKNGFLCDAFNFQSIKEKLKYAIELNNADKEKLILNAKQTAKSYAIENKAKEYLKQITSILSN